MSARRRRHALKNSFGVTLAHLALRFSRESLIEENAAVARAAQGEHLGHFRSSTLVASLALVGALRRLAHGVAHAEAALIATTRACHRTGRTQPVRLPLQRFILTTRSVGREIEKLNDCSSAVRSHERSLTARHLSSGLPYIGVGRHHGVAGQRCAFTPDVRPCLDHKWPEGASVGASVRALAFKWADNGVELKELYAVNHAS